MRIAYLADPSSANSLYRAHIPMSAVERDGRHVVRALLSPGGQALRVPMQEVDLLYVHRYCDRRAQQLIQEAKQAGAAVMWDNDDDMGAMPKSLPAYKHFGGMAWERRLAQMRRIFQEADLVTAPSRVLAARFEKWGASATEVTENYLVDMPITAPGRQRNGRGAGLTVGWVAGLEHAIDTHRLPIVEVLQRLLDERPDLHVVLIGLGLELRSDRYEHLPLVPLPKLSQHLATFDLAIAPLADVDFNSARSNIKLKEYAAAGTPWLASPIGPYVGMGERQGGRLVADDGWHEAITRLLDKPRERQKLAKRGARWAAGQTISKNVGVWEGRFAVAVERSGGGVARGDATEAAQLSRPPCNASKRYVR